MRERPSQWVTEEDMVTLEAIDALDIESWVAYAECGSTNDERFFPVGDKDEQQPAAIADYCARCPVVAKCLQYALASPGTTQYGSWGGLTQNQLKALRLRRKRENV